MSQDEESAVGAKAAVQSLKNYSFFMFATMGVWAPYLTLYYKTQGLTGKEIGFLSALIPLSVLLVPPFWGYITDRAKDPRRIQFICVVFTGLGLFPCMFGNSFWYFLPFIILFAFFNAPLIPLCDSQTFACIDKYGSSYGAIRIWGSAGFNFSLLVISGVFLCIPNMRVIFIVFILTALCALWCLQHMPKLPSRLRRGEYLKGIKLLRNKEFIVFIIGVLINRLTMTPLYIFFGIYLRELEMPLYSIGLIWCIGPLAELILFNYGESLLRFIGIKGLLVTSLVAGVIRLLILSFGPPTWIILLSQLLHALTFAANHLGAVTYVDSCLPSNLRASGQTIFAALAIGLGSSTGAFLGGYLFDRVGIFSAFAFVSIISAVGAVFLLVAFHPKKRERELRLS